MPEPGAKPQVKRVVLTGGPCAGKTTALARLSDWFGKLGWRVLCVPESATMLLQGGAGPPGSDPFEFQAELMRLQRRLEETFFDLACNVAVRNGSNVLVIHDRGIMDSAAYSTPEQWQATLDAKGWSLVELRDARYDGVVHMVTAAIGAEHAYTLANNSARTETLEQAREADKRTLDAWIGHPHLRIVENKGDFDKKVREVIRAVSRIVGVPEPLEAERKYLVKSADPIPLRHETVEIEQTYLAGSGSERVRRRGQHGSHVYTHTVKTPTGRAGERIETERQIEPREYVRLLGRADPSRHPVRKTRTCFMWKGRYYELDRFVSPREGLTLLEVEVDDPADTDIKIPPFIHVERDVTDEPEWTNSALAVKAKP